MSIKISLAAVLYFAFTISGKNFISDLSLQECFILQTLVWFDRVLLDNNIFGAYFSSALC